MKERLDSHRLSNGMILLGEPMADVESASFYFLLLQETPFIRRLFGSRGSYFRLAIPRSRCSHSRALIEALDELGIHRNSSVTAENLSLSASLESANLLAALDLYADILTAPLLEDEQFEPSGNWHCMNWPGWTMIRSTRYACWSRNTIIPSPIIALPRETRRFGKSDRRSLPPDYLSTI